MKVAAVLEPVMRTAAPRHPGALVATEKPVLQALNQYHALGTTIELSSAMIKLVSSSLPRAIPHISWLFSLFIRVTCSARFSITTEHFAFVSLTIRHPRTSRKSSANRLISTPKEPGKAKWRPSLVICPHA